MMKIILAFMLTLSTFMMNLTHPLPLGLMILIQTIFICLITRIVTFSSWMPLTMFLVMVGGLMIIFIYVTSVCSNKKFNKKKSKLSLFFILISILMIYNQSFMINFFDTVQLKDNFNFEFFKLFMPVNLSSSMFIFLYLLIALMIMINLLSKSKGPLRKKY
uniref:NADH-ubiquinone oxidoreductase chain 6 n=1 Tax=Trioza urticae TaxID=121826 RepID=A0A344A2X1_TRIUR|nr:NADH dehydrogenase subunit 6 [Trioza urticae]AWU49112.1 NADH dehydrogenase subunit 6 [Trioza urticae]